MWYNDVLMTHPRQVFLNSDANGIVLLSVAVHSLLKHNDPACPIVLYIAHDRGFAEQGCCTRIADIVGRFAFAKVVFLDFSPWQAKHDGAFEPMLWAFPLCDKILPADVTGKILYLDIDMLVRKDLGFLFGIDLKGAGMMAAAVNESRREHRPYLIDAGWPEEAGYSFNNATSLVDLDAFRRERVSDRIIDWYVAHRKTAVNTDQDSQNMMYGAKTLRIPVKWNYTDGWLERIPRMNPFAREWRVFPPNDVLEAALDPCIIHYIGRRKPTGWTHRPERNVYRKALRELGLINGRLPGETPVRRIEGALFDLYHQLIRAYARVLLAVRRGLGFSGSGDQVKQPLQAMIP